MQALKQVRLLQGVSHYGSLAPLLGMAYLFGHGSGLTSLPVLASLLLAAGLLVAEKKLQQLELHFGFLDWQHSEH